MAYDMKNHLIPNRQRSKYRFRLDLIWALAIAVIDVLLAFSIQYLPLPPGSTGEALGIQMVVNAIVIPAAIFKRWWLTAAVLGAGVMLLWGVLGHG